MKGIFQGILIGLGKIIPGVSGSVIAISLGVYEQAIEFINHFFKNIKESVKYLLPIGIGVIISIVFASKIIINLLDNYYLPTILFFIGLIIGSINDITKEVNKKYTYITIIAFAIMLILSFFSSHNEMVFNNYLYKFLFYVLVGIIDAITMVVPGISGTAILMMIGCYNTIMLVLSNLTNINHLLDNISILLPFFLGLIIGMIITIKLVSYLFSKHYTKTYNAILGFLLASIIYMFISTINCYYTIYQVFVGMILFVAGYILVKKINRN